jgi:predicted amidophosphoribosyltransferase
MSYGYDVTCPWCGSINSDDNAYCNICGGAITSILCNRCLTTSPPTAAFCGRCGEMLQYVEDIEVAEEEQW